MPKSVCLSVRPSVTLMGHALTVQDIEICFAPHDRGTFLKFLETKFAILNSELAAGTIALKRHPLDTSKIGRNNPSIITARQRAR